MKHYFDYLIRGVGRKELNENNDAPALDNICAEEEIQSHHAREWLYS